MYNLEEFKRWLEANPEEKRAKLNWDDSFNRYIRNNTELEKLIKREDIGGACFSSDGWDEYRVATSKWLVHREHLDYWKQELERLKKELENQVKNLETKETNYQQQIQQIKEQKDTFQKSADYLRETLKATEKDLENIKKELAQAQENAQAVEEEKDKLLTEKEEELRQKQEAFKVIQERNSDLQTKLSQASGEISQLTEWISKLESASVEGDAFANLKAELTKSQQIIRELEEQLNAKSPRSYWWVYVLVALVGVWLVVK